MELKREEKNPLDDWEENHLELSTNLVLSYFNVSFSVSAIALRITWRRGEERNNTIGQEVTTNTNSPVDNQNEETRDGRFSKNVAALIKNILQLEGYFQLIQLNIYFQS